MDETTKPPIQTSDAGNGRLRAEVRIDDRSAIIFEGEPALVREMTLSALSLLAPQAAAARPQPKPQPKPQPNDPRVTTSRPLSEKERHAMSASAVGRVPMRKDVATPIGGGPRLHRPQPFATLRYQGGGHPQDPRVQNAATRPLAPPVAAGGNPVAEHSDEGTVDAPPHDPGT